MSTNQEKSSSPKGNEAERIPLVPSRNQKQRSRLKQSQDEPPPAPPPPPAPVAPPPKPPAENEGLIRRMRLKRSGQMREDLLLPDDSPTDRRDDVY